MTRPVPEDPAVCDFVLNAIPPGRPGRPEDPLGAVVFPASDASGLFIRSALTAHGGWTAR